MGGGWDRFTREDGGSVQSNPTPAQARALSVACWVTVAFVVAVMAALSAFGPAVAGADQKRQPTWLWMWHEPGTRGEKMCGPTHTCFGYMDIEDMATCERVVKRIIQEGGHGQDQFFCGYLYRVSP